MTALNYATQYSQALAQAYPYVLYFAALFQTEKHHLCIRRRCRSRSRRKDTSASPSV